MTPHIIHPHAHGHSDDLHREAEHRHAIEAHVRQMIRRAPTRQTIRRTRMIPTASHR